MARHTKTITIEEKGRDEGKVFILTEMPAMAGEKWAMQLMHLISQAGAEVVSAEAANAGMSGLASLLPKGGDVDPTMALAMARALGDPSLESWWDCVRYQHAPNLPLQAIMQGAACQIEEIRTIAELRMEVVKLHTDFFSPASTSTSDSPSPGSTPTGSLPTRMSRPRSVP